MQQFKTMHTERLNALRFPSVVHRKKMHFATGFFRFISQAALSLRSKNKKNKHVIGGACGGSDPNDSPKGKIKSRIIDLITFI